MEMEIRPLRTDSEIEEYIRRHYGSVEEYHRWRHDVPPAPIRNLRKCRRVQRRASWTSVMWLQRASA